METGTTPSANRITKEQICLMLKQMLTIRLFEEKVVELYRKGQIPGFAHVSMGQEAVPVGVCTALRADDYITSTHRGHGHCLAKGAEIGRMFAELFGKITGYCQGKGGSMHIANSATGNLGANAIVGGSIAIATGAAFSAKNRKTKQVAVCFFGDGAMNEGVFLESLNLASIWNLPVIYVCENNQYGEYTPLKKVTAGDIHKRGEAFDIPTAAVDGMDVLAVEKAAANAVNRARADKGPSFLVMETYRYIGHGMGDVNRPYRTREEEQEWRQNRDPIDRLWKHLLEEWNAAPDYFTAISAEVASQIDKAIEEAQGAPYPLPEDVTKHVYSD
jgi:pyruvate dehydrogenase E1 component alpha subunit